MQPVSSTNAGSPLDDVLVVTTHKYIWDSPEIMVFPHRLYEKRIGKQSQNKPSIYFLGARALLYTLRHKPKIILFGAAHKTVPRFIELKRRGYLPGTKLIATNQVSFNDSQAKYLDKIIVYCRSEIALHDPQLKGKYGFVPIPVDAKYPPFPPASLIPKRGAYIFSGGGTGRDFQSLIEAVKGLEVRVMLVAPSVQALGYDGALPDNCEFLGRVSEYKFLELMANSMFVAVPLAEGLWAHGHTVVAQALALGKAVVTTKNSSCEDYVTDNVEGILVAPGDVQGYREAILRLQSEPGCLDAFESRAKIKAQQMTYQSFTRRLTALCGELLAA